MCHSRVPLLLVLAAAASMRSHDLAAQRPVLPLEFRFDVRYSQPFSGIRGVRELSDGSILVADMRDVALYHIVNPNGPVRSLIRKGAGPGEVQSISRVLSGHADTTYLIDGSQRRLIVLAGARIVRTTSSDESVWNHALRYVVGFDRQGNIYGLRDRQPRGRNGMPITLHAQDTAEVVRVPAGSRQEQTLFATRGDKAPYRMVVKTVGGVTSHYQLMARFDRPDLVAVCHDGILLHASPSQGRAWWRGGGPPVSVTSPAFIQPPVTEARKRQVILEDYGPEFADQFRADEYPPWPTKMPAFAEFGAWCLPSGDGLLEANREPDGSRRIYLVNRDGTVVNLPNVPTGARIAGVGNQSVYFNVETEEGEVTLVRYRLRTKSAR